MANDGDTEIEIQVKIERSKKLLAFLKKNGKFIGESHQVDQYFTPAHRDFTGVRPVNEWLRLRNSSGKYSINYKNWHRDPDGNNYYCDEFETPVADLGQIEKIFKAINFRPVVTVDKIRKIWLYKNYEVAADSVKGLKGDSIEIEYKGKTRKQTPAEITKGMFAFLKQFDCGKMFLSNYGYAFELLSPKEAILKEI